MEFTVIDTYDCETSRFDTLDAARAYAKSVAEWLVEREYFGETVTISMIVPFEACETIRPTPAPPIEFCTCQTVVVTTTVCG